MGRQSLLATVLTCSVAAVGCDRGNNSGSQRESAGASAVPTRQKLRFPDPRKADDCVAFLRAAYRQAGRGTERVRPAGAPPRLLEEVFWFGPQLGKRRAIVGVEDIQVSVGESSADDEPFPMYSLSYQVRADGCQTHFLPGYEPRPPNWGPGREIQVTNMPLHSQEGRLALRDIPKARLRGRPIRTADRRAARVVFVADPDPWHVAVTVVIDRTLVAFQLPKKFGVTAAVRQLRAIEKASSSAD
jgi:hypothetical protein